LIDTFEATYPGHNATLKTLYGTTKKLWVHVYIEYEDVEEWVPPPLDVCNLESKAPSSNHHDIIYSS
jgi:hypothetical protein